MTVRRSVPAPARRARALPFVALLATVPLVACVAPKAPPPPPQPEPVAVTPLAPAPVATDWRDLPLTPGDWRYDATTRTARFGTAGAPLLIVRCDAAGVSIARVAVAGGAATMAITTSAGTRALAASPAAGPPPALSATLPARDGFLDRMAFSRGRFVIAVSGTQRLVIPNWPEFARVVEECRP